MRQITLSAQTRETCSCQQKCPMIFLEIQIDQEVVCMEVHDLLVDIKAEKVEATEVKLDDMDLSPETLVGGENGALVEVESLLDNVYSAAVEKLPEQCTWKCWYYLKKMKKRIMVH